MFQVMRYIIYLINYFVNIFLKNMYLIKDYNKILIRLILMHWYFGDMATRVWIILYFSYILIFCHHVNDPCNHEDTIPKVLPAFVISQSLYDMTCKYLKIKWYNLEIYWINICPWIDRTFYRWYLIIDDFVMIIWVSCDLYLSVMWFMSCDLYLIVMWSLFECHLHVVYVDQFAFFRL